MTCGTEFMFKTHIIRKLNIRYKQLLKNNLIEDIYSFTKDKDYLYININKKEDIEKAKKQKELNISSIIKNDNIEF